MCLGLSPFYSIWGESWGISGPVHACRAGSSLEMVDLKLVISHSLCLSVSLSLSLTHTLFCQRCCAVSGAGKVPFPSISGRLQRSVIGEINGTGPISCLVPFESAKLLRTSKKMSQFIWDLFSPLCKCQTHTPNRICSVTKPRKSCTFTHSHMHIQRKRGPAFWLKKDSIWHQAGLQWHHDLNNTFMLGWCH